MRYLNNYPNYLALYESLRTARSIIGNEDILNRILEIDPSKTKKYAGWLAKNFQKEPWDNDNEIKNLIVRYDNLLHKGKADRRDINAFNSISDLNDYTNRIEKTSRPSKKEDSLNYDVILDNSDVFIVRPLSHKAARKLGLTRFAAEFNNYTGKYDCRWCITHGDSDHWVEHFLDSLTTFYFVHLKKERPPYNYISVSVKPKREPSTKERRGKIKHPIETQILYHNAEDNAVPRDKELSQEEEEAWDVENLIHMDDLMNKYGIKHLFKPAYIKERYSEEELKKYPGLGQTWLERFKAGNPELFDPEFEITFKDQEPTFNPHTKRII